MKMKLFSVEFLELNVVMFPRYNRTFNISDFNRRYNQLLANLIVATASNMLLHVVFTHMYPGLVLMHCKQALTYLVIVSTPYLKESGQPCFENSLHHD